MDERTRLRQFEDQFLAQLRNRAAKLTGATLPADTVLIEAMPDGADAIRAALTRLEVFDRELAGDLPGGKSVQYRFFRASLGGLLRRNVAQLRAQVLAPLEALVKGQPAGPVSRDQVLDAVARFEVLPQRDRPTAVVFASATGFTADALSVAAGSGSPAVILMTGRADGGWDIEMSPALRRTPWARLFELETQDEQLKRLVYHLEQNAAELDSRGLSVSTLGQRMGLPPEQAEALVRRACASQPRLMTVVHDGVLHVSRSPLAEDGRPMSVWARIRKWLGLKPTAAERVRELQAQSVRLQQQRSEVDQKVGALQAAELQAIERGKAAGSDAEKRQIAGSLLRLRTELKRHQTQSAMFTQQIDVIGTHIHHLTLTEQGKRLSLPKAEDLTAEAAQAERVMAELGANADLARSIEVGATTPMMADEVDAILAEFAAAPAAEASKSKAAAPAATVSAPAAASPPPAEKAPAAPAKPELG